MRRIAYGVGVLAAVLLAALHVSTAGATETGAPTFQSCAHLSGWYTNPDEADLLPEPTANGLRFEGKDLIHHQTEPIDFADVEKTNKSFTATTAGKVVFKMETSGPYSNIVINADGKAWSTAFNPDADGGLSHPVAKITDLLDKPLSMKPGKQPYTAASRVITFGVGYWVEEGSTVVSSISFHGTTYDLKCAPPASPSSASPSVSSPSPTHTGAPTSGPVTVKPTTKGPATPTPGETTPGASNIVIANSGDTLPKTGFPVVSVALIGAAMVFGGAFLALVAWRRRNA